MANDSLDPIIREEIEKRMAASSLPPISICLRGFANQVEADKVGGPARIYLQLFGAFLNLERLEAVTIAHDYDAALGALDTGTGRTQAATRDGFAVGTAMRVRLLRDGRPKAQLCFYSDCASYSVVAHHPNSNMYVSL